MHTDLARAGFDAPRSCLLHLERCLLASDVFATDDGGCRCAVGVR